MFSLPNASERQTSLSTSIIPRYQGNGVKLVFNKDYNTAGEQALSLPNNCGELIKSKGPETPSLGLRVFSVPVRRVRGLTAALNKLDLCPFIFETVGRIVELEEMSPSGCTAAFRLEEHGERHHAVQMNCLFEDVDNIHPEIFNGQTYRCVGKFSMSRSTFQCYSISPCDDVDLQLLEIFQMYSDNVITQMLSRN